MGKMTVRPHIQNLLSAVFSSRSWTGWLKLRQLVAKPFETARDPDSARCERAAPRMNPGPAELLETDGGECADDVAEVLQEDNRRLRRELQTLAREAENNEAIFRRFHQLELSLLNANSLISLLDRMTRETQDILSLDEVSLVLHDPEREVASLLVCGGPTRRISPRVVLVDQASDCSPGGSSLNRPWLGPFRKEHSNLFHAPERVRSVALLPLLSQGCLFGSLNLASADPARYTRSHAYDFHSRLAAVSSLCLQNAINRERLVISGHTDLLTRWYNRRYMEMRLPEELARAVRYAEPLSCLLFDVDHFKQINDCYGHVAGDDVLREMAARIKKGLRVSDLAVRYGGEEFVVFLIRTTREEAAIVAERIRSCVADGPFRADKRHSLTVTVSVGVADLAAAAHARDARALGKALLEKADTALYQAKAQGRNRVVLSGDRAG